MKKRVSKRRGRRAGVIARASSENPSKSGTVGPAPIFPGAGADHDAGLLLRLAKRRVERSHRLAADAPAPLSARKSLVRIGAGILLPIVAR